MAPSPDPSRKGRGRLIGASMPDIECFFDCSSPWTYFAFHNLLLMQKELGIDIAWRPILVGGVFNAVNPSVHNSREKPVPAKSAYGKKDQQDWARHLGIRMHYRPTVFPVNSVTRDARLHPAGARGQAGAVRAGDVRGLLGRRQGHLAGPGAARDLRQGRRRCRQVPRRHRAAGRSRTGCAPSRRS